jgi:hypothetical protein
MGVSRNAPCPCGSGRKYKGCCVGADRARERTAAAVGVAASWHPHARAATVWEADVVPLPAGLEDDPDATPSVVMVVAAGFVVVADVRGRWPVGVEERARVVGGAVRQAAGVLGVLPPRLCVRDGALAAALEEEMRERAVEVEAGPLAELDEALTGTLEHLCGSSTAGIVTAVSTWAGTEAEPEAIAAFHEAAAEFYEAAPWERLDDADLLQVHLADGSVWTASVLGGGGMEFGLALYSELADLLGIMDGDESPEARLERMEGFALTASFEKRSGLPRPLQREVASRGWRVAGPSAYPVLIGMHLPERRITAAHVRTAAAVLRAIALLARGEEPDPAEVQAVVPLADDEESFPWPLPDAAALICPEGPGADPEAALRSWDEGDPFGEAEEARLARMRAWIEETARSRAARDAELRNAEHWTAFLGYHGLAAGAVTEYDLRVFLYDFYSRKVVATRAAARALPRSMRRIFEFLEGEGIRYPFAGGVLDELEALGREARGQGSALDTALEELLGEVYPYLDARGLLHDRELPGAGGWPPMMSIEVAELEHELQRRWLLWYDEGVRRGVTDPMALRQVLVGRQREWENTPHPAMEGRTPARVVREYLAEER